MVTYVAYLIQRSDFAARKTEIAIRGVNFGQSVGSLTLVISASCGSELGSFELGDVQGDVISWQPAHIRAMVELKTAHGQFPRVVAPEARKRCRFASDASLKRSDGKTSNRQWMDLPRTIFNDSSS